MQTLKRTIFKHLVRHLERKEHTIVIGARQTGKTTLLYQLQEHISTQGQAASFVTLEDTTVLNLLNEHPENIFRLIKKTGDERMILLIDEIQYLDNPSNFLKLLYDKHAGIVKIVATGSSAFYIDQKFTDSLAGRKRLFELYTLDFEEYLLFKQVGEKINAELKHIRDNHDYISLHRPEINRWFDDFLTWGGYPAVVLSDDDEEKKLLLKEIFSSFIRKDALEAGIQHQGKFAELLLLLAHQTGSLLNVNELSNTLGLSTTAVTHYLQVLVKCFHIQLVRPFYQNIRKELTKMPKVYFHDLGLRNIIMNTFTPIEKRIDKGLIAENYVYTRLRHLTGNDHIHFWRTADGDELDFICTSNQGKIAIETKFDLKEFRPGKYKKFSLHYPDIPIHCRAYKSDANANSILAM